MNIMELGALGSSSVRLVSSRRSSLAIQIRQNTSSAKTGAFQAWGAMVSGPLMAVEQNSETTQAVLDGLRDSVDA